jgi:hypothetical protein
VRQERPDPSRRQFCFALGGALLVPACGNPPPLFAPGGGGTADLSGALPPTPPDLATGPSCTADGGTGVSGGNVIAVGAITEMAGFFVCRDGGGLYALSHRCSYDPTSQVNWQSGQSLFICAGCASHFNYAGQVLTPPAQLPLVHFLLCLDGGGNITVDATAPVSPSQRVSV